MILLFLITAFLIGATVVYAVPMVNGWAAKVPGAAKIANNRFANLLLIGVVVLLALHLFTVAARKL